MGVASWPARADRWPATLRIGSFQEEPRALDGHRPSIGAPRPWLKASGAGHTLASLHARLKSSTGFA
jgi:hypothetical protein